MRRGAGEVVALTPLALSLSPSPCVLLLQVQCSAVRVLSNLCGGCDVNLARCRRAAADKLLRETLAANT